MRHPFFPLKQKKNVKNSAFLSCNTLVHIVMNLLGISNLGIIGTTSQATDSAALTPPWQPLPLIPHVISVLSHFHGLLANINDPLRFPCAEGSVIKIISPSSTDYPIIHTKIYEIIELERKNAIEKQLSQSAILLQPNSSGNNVAYVIDALIEAKRTQKLDSLLITIISDMLISSASSKLHHHIRGEKKHRIINAWIEQQIFGDDFNNYQRTRTFNSGLRPEKLIYMLTQDINNKLYNTFKHLPLEVGQTVKLYVVEHIVNKEFPAYTYSFHRAVKDPFQWGLCHAGYYFLNKLHLDMEKFTSEEVYSLGYTLYQLFRYDLLPSEWVRFFSIPAMITYSLSFTDNVINSIVDDAEAFQEAALNDFFDYKPHHAADENSILRFHQALSGYISFLDTSTAARLAVNLNSDYEKHIRQVANKHANADYMYMSAAFSQLHAEEKEFIYHAEILPGAITYRSPGKKTGYDSTTTTPIQTTFITEVIETPLVKIFKCILNNEHRLYALLLGDDGYGIKRIENGAQELFRLLPKQHLTRRNDPSRLSTLFLDQDKISASEGVKTLKSRLRDSNTLELLRVLNNYYAEQRSKTWIKSRLITYPSAPFRHCFYSEREEPQSGDYVLTCGNDYSIERLNPFHLHPSKHSPFNSYTMALNMKRLLDKIPDNMNENNAQTDKSTSSSRKADLKETIRYGLRHCAGDIFSRPIYALNNRGVNKALQLCHDVIAGNSILNDTLNKIHNATNDVYRHQPDTYAVILVANDHVNHRPLPEGMHAGSLDQP